MRPAQLAKQTTRGRVPFGSLGSTDGLAPARGVAAREMSGVAPFVANRIIAPSESRPRPAVAASNAVANRRPARTPLVAAA